MNAWQLPLILLSLAFVVFVILICAPTGSFFPRRNRFTELRKSRDHRRKSLQPEASSTTHRRASTEAVTR